MTSMAYMNVRAIGWSGILQIAAFAGASFYSLGPGLGKRGRRAFWGGGHGEAAGAAQTQLAVIASAAKQSIAPQKEWIASSLSRLAMTDRAELRSLELHLLIAAAKSASDIGMVMVSLVRSWKESDGRVHSAACLTESRSPECASSSGCVDRLHRVNAFESRSR
jgi:hypothetical protein